MTSLMNRTSEIARMASTSAISAVMRAFIHDMQDVGTLCKTVRMVLPQSYKAVQRGLRREFDIRGVQYSVTEWGDRSAPLFFYLHGWGDTGSTFQFVVDALSRAWHVVAPDWRGFGHSSVECTSYWFPDYLADLHELLAIYSSDRPARIVGHSMGANIAGLYAGTMPERVQALVNVEGFGLCRLAGARRTHCKAQSTHERCTSGFRGPGVGCRMRAWSGRTASRPAPQIAEPGAVPARRSGGVLAGNYG